MKMAIALCVVAVTATGVAAQTHHANAPRDLWCRDMMLIEGSVQYCMAYTFEQCMASRQSPNERCYLNPLYDSRFRRR